MAREEGTDDLVNAYKKATPGEAVDPADQGEYDNEGAMAKTSLRGIVADASHMIEMFDDEQNLPEWVQAKITKSADYLNSAHRYMMNKENVNEASLRMKIAKRGGVADKIRDYGRKSGGIDKAAFLKIAAMIDGSESNAKIQSAIQKMDTDPRDWVIKVLDDNGFIKGGKVKITEETIKEAIDMSKAGKYARVMNPKTREIKKVLKTDVRKYVDKGWTHMTQLKNRLTKREETVSEKLTVADGMDAWIKDFQASDAPQFEGKDKEERRNMAIAAYLAAKKEAKKESKAVKEETKESEVAESDANWEKALAKQHLDRLSDKDKQKLAKLAIMLSKERKNKKK